MILRADSWYRDLFARLDRVEILLARIDDQVQRGLCLIESIDKQTRQLSCINQGLERVKTLVTTLTGILMRVADEDETN